MEEIEVMSWLTLDALKKNKAAQIVETVGNLQTGHSMSVFCTIEDDFLELCYGDEVNALRCYEDRDEFDAAIEERKEDVGEAHFDDDSDYDEDEKEDEESEDEGKDGEGTRRPARTRTKVRRLDPPRPAARRGAGRAPRGLREWRPSRSSSRIRFFISRSAAISRSSGKRKSCARSRSPGSR
jgi:hypothetical protein